MTRNFGIECELSSGTEGVLEALGLPHLHAYHCCCADCRPFRSAPDWTAQEDCTADGEVISRVLTYGTGAANYAIENLTAALRAGRATTSDRVGLHVHVSNEGMTPEAWVHFWRLWFRYESTITGMAQGRFREVRSYNSRVTPRTVIGDPGGGLWRRFWTGDPATIALTIGQPYGRATYVNPHTGHDTIEFRLWNATRVGWRVHLAVGVSVALVECAIEGNSPTRDDERNLIDFLGPYLTDESYAAVLRHYTYLTEVAA